MEWKFQFFVLKNPQSACWAARSAGFRSYLYSHTHNIFNWSIQRHSTPRDRQEEKIMLTLRVGDKKFFFHDFIILLFQHDEL